MGRGTACLLLVMAGLTALIAIELGAGAGNEGHNPPPPASPGTDLPPVLPELAVTPLSNMDQTAARPLFSRSRRPPPPPPAEVREEKAAPAVPSAPAKPPPEPKPEFHGELSATVISGDGASAYLSAPGEAALVRLRRGETLDGWRLVEVRPEAVVLEHGAHRIELRLRPLEEMPGEPDETASGTRAPGGRDDMESAKRPRHEAADRPAESRPPRRPGRGPRSEALERALRRALPAAADGD